MRANKLFKRPKAENGAGRSVKYKHILIPEELADELDLYKTAYELRLGLKRVTYEQMFRRWLEHIDRIDPDIPGALKEAAEVRLLRMETRKKMAAGLGLTVEQLEENERSFDPTEGEVWELKYSFEKDGEELEAVPGDLTPFYAKYKGRNTGMAAMLKDGWTFQNELGCELTPEQAEVISNKIKEHNK